MKKFRIAFIVVVGLLLYSIALSALVRNVYFANHGDSRWFGAGKSVKFMAELPSYVKQALAPPAFYVSNEVSEGGLSINAEAKLDSLYPKLLVTYKVAPFQQQFELLEMPTGKSLKIWTPDNKFLYENAHREENPRKPPKNSDLYFIHPLMLADSSLIFNCQLSSLLVRVNTDSEVVWMKNDHNYHHSQELDSEGMVWTCSRPFSSGDYDFFPEDNTLAKAALMDDAITKIDPENGEILFKKSVIQILNENGYKSLVIQKGQVISDPIHLNDIQPALTSTDYWEKDDLLVSCRNINVVFLYRPSTDKIIWLKQGPWDNQHDADFVGDHRISIFGNDILREESSIDPKMTNKDLYFSTKRDHNNVYVYDFKLDTVTTPYTELLKNEQIRTITSGRSEILRSGDIFIEETNNGRIIIGDSISRKMEFVKRLDESYISSLFWSRLIY